MEEDTESKHLKGGATNIFGGRGVISSVSRKTHTHTPDATSNRKGVASTQDVIILKLNTGKLQITTEFCKKL